MTTFPSSGEFPHRDSIAYRLVNLITCIVISLQLELNGNRFHTFNDVNQLVIIPRSTSRSKNHTTLPDDIKYHVHKNNNNNPIR